MLRECSPCSEQDLRKREHCPTYKYSFSVKLLQADLQVKPWKILLSVISVYQSASTGTVGAFSC